jgi:pSer/pThr/pTyr-binding forkhead associated (FHA) protein
VVTKPLEPRQPLPIDEDPQVSAAREVPIPLDTEPSPPPPDITPEQSGPAWRVLFNITGPQPTQVGLDIWRVTVLGRADPMSAFRPDMDYAPYGAMRHGVSRRHALVRPGEQALYLIDQNSTNGTWVNGQRLMPGREFRLSDNDIIELGALRMVLRVVQSPQDADESHPAVERPIRGRRFRFLLRD